MTFAVKDWKDYPDESTPILASELESMETRLSDYTDVGSMFVSVKSRTYGAKGDGVTDDRAAIQAALTFVAAAGGGVVFFPAGTYIVKGVLEIDSKVTIQGCGPLCTILKSGKEAKVSVLKSKRYNVGGTTGGTEAMSVKDIQFDGNIAENAGVTEAVVNLDGIRPLVENVVIRNGKINLKSIMSREDKSSEKLEDGIYTNIGLFNSEEFNFLFEGPHDTTIDHLLAQTNKGINVSVRKVSVWTDCHAYGASTYSWQMRGGSFYNCIGEGAKTAQASIQRDGLKLHGCEFFSSGAEDGKVGISFGEEAGTAFTTIISDVKIEDCTNGAFKFEVSASNSLISGLVSAASGNIKSGASSASDVDMTQVRCTGGCVDNVNFRTVASTGTLEVPKGCEFIELTGTSNVTKITATKPNHKLVIKFASTAKVTKGENLKLKATFNAQAEDVLMLICDGTNWTEIDRKQNPSQTVASANTITVGSGLNLVKVTGVAEIKKIEPTYDGHVIFLKFAEAAKIVDGENLKLIETKTFTADDVIGLVCDGTNWYQTAPVAAN